MHQLCSDYEDIRIAAVVLSSGKTVVLQGKKKLLLEYAKENR